ncbi:hypothetical protein QWY99_06005 [Flavobacterium branchiarum]|uniref:Uncharacterized protein n=1 Tax=Flavobacterium branchiarum TaxID=1114870 RepID=A0ABV5FMK8_9FLAO|nr:hypothetical protein [Flavobacterium branchiarum]MDN3672606.1 hypothetical protein [Flavobacterium branchiarum]
MWYKVDWDRLVLLLLPTFLRKTVLFGYLSSLVSPIANLHYQWLQIREDNLKKLSYNSQKCYLRKAINDKFDPDLRRITIGNTAQVDQDYLYTQAENIDVYLGVMYLEQDFNYISGMADFIINVPASILNQKINEITALVDFYVLAGKSYQFVIYE